MVTDRTEFVGINGVRLGLRRVVPPGLAFDPSAPVWVFLHEALGSIAQWKDFPERLCAASGRAGIIYERRGHGRSDPLPAGAIVRPQAFHRDEARDWLRPLLAALDLRRPLLFGHSDGATIALAYAALFPDQVEAVVSEAAHVFVEEITLAGIRDAVAAYATTDLGERLACYHGEKTAVVFRSWSETWLKPTFRDWDMTAALAAIRCPVVALQGAQDEYGSVAQLDAIAAGVSGPVVTRLLPDCRHIPHFQATDAVLAAIATHLPETVAR